MRAFLQAVGCWLPASVLSACLLASCLLASCLLSSCLLASCLLSSCLLSSCTQDPPPRALTPDDGASRAAGVAADGANAADRGRSSALGREAGASGATVRRADAVLEFAPERDLRVRLVDSLSSEPIAGASVCFRRQWSGMLEARGTTDARGVLETTFGLARGAQEEMPPGCLASFEARHPQYATLRDLPWMAGACDIVDFDDACPIDLGTLSLERGAAIGGVVRDAAGTPVANASLFLARAGELESGLFGASALFAGRTAASGAMEVSERVPAVEAAPWVLIAVSSRGFGWRRIDVAAGAAALGPLELRLSPPASLEVRVVDERGDPVPEAVVLVEPCFAPFRAREDPLAAQMEPDAPELAGFFARLTDASGRARFAHLPGRVDPYAPDSRATRCAIRVRHRRFLPFQIEGERLDPSAPRTLVCALAERPPTRLDGLVIGPDEAGIAGARLSVDEGPSAASRADGGFELRGFEPVGEHVEVHVVAAGFVPARFPADVGPAGSASGVRFQLGRTAPVAGLVVDDTGAPVAGARLALVPADEPASGVREAQLATESAADGWFRIEEAPEGGARLHVVPPEPVEGWWRPEPVATRGGAEDLRVVLDRRTSSFARVEIRTIDSVSRAAVPCTGVRVVERMREDVAAKRPRGRRSSYELPVEIGAEGAVLPRVPPGTWLAVIESEGRIGEPIVFTVTEQADRLQLDALLEQAGTIEGRVADPGESGNMRDRYVQAACQLDEPTSESNGEDGAGMGSDPVLEPYDVGRWRSDTCQRLAHVGPDGAFCLSGLRAGTWSVVLEEGGVSCASAAVNVRAGGVVRVELVPARLSTVRCVGAAPPRLEDHAVVMLEFHLAGSVDNRIAVGVVRKGRLALVHRLPAGTWSWTLLAGATDPEEPHEVIAEGQIVLADGKDAEIVLPAKQR